MKDNIKTYSDKCRRFLLVFLDKNNAYADSAYIRGYDNGVLFSRADKTSSVEEQSSWFKRGWNDGYLSGFRDGQAGFKPVVTAPVRENRDG